MKISVAHYTYLTLVGLFISQSVSQSQIAFVNLKYSWMEFKVPCYVVVQTKDKLEESLHFFQYFKFYKSKFFHQEISLLCYIIFSFA